MFGYVLKRSEDDYVVNVDLDSIYSGYNVVPKDIDPENEYDIEEVRAYCEANPEMVLSEHPMEERVLLIREKQRLENWLNAHDYIGVKIATGRATVEEYAEEIAEMNAKAERINEIDALLEG
mgnify:CR=1 FL=1